MAFRTSEIRLILTARNEASRVIRRVGRDVGQLDEATKIKHQLARTQSIIQQKKARIDDLQAARQSLLSGKKALDLEKRMKDAKDAVKVAQQARKKAVIQATVDEVKASSTLYRDQLRNMKNLRIVERQLLSDKISDVRRGDLELEHAALKTEQRRLQQLSALLPGDVGAATRRVSAAKRRVDAVDRAQVQAAVSAMRLSREIQRELDAIDALGTKAQDLQAKLSNVRLDKINRLGSIATHVGTAMVTTGGIAVATLGLMARAAANFGTELTLAATQARPMDKSFAATAGIATRLNKIVLDQMQQFPAASEEMANSLYEIFSGTNIQAPALAAKNLEILNKAAVAGGTDLKTMTSAGITLLNNFVGQGREFKNLNQAMDVFFSAVRYGRMSADQFANSLANVVPIAETAGLTFHDVADAMAVLTRQSGARFTSRDATGLARLIEIFGKTDVQAGLQNKFGISVERAGGGMRSLLEIMKEIQARAKLKPGAATLNFFKEMSAAGGLGKGNAGTIQARRAFAFLIKNMTEYERVSNKVNQTQGEFNASFRAMAKTPGIRWEIFVNQMKALSIIIGTSLIPVFSKLGFYIGKVINWFENLKPSTRDLIARFVLVGSVVAIVAGVLAAFVGSLAIIGVAMVKFLRNIGLMGRVTGESGQALTEVVIKFGLVASAIAVAIPLLVKYHSQIMGLINAIGGLGNVLTALTVAAITNSMAKLALEAYAAEKAVTKLRLALMRLAAIGVVVIAVEIIMHKKDLDDLENAIKEKLGFEKSTTKAMELFSPDTANRIAKTFGQDKLVEMQGKVTDALVKRARSLGMTLPELLNTASRAQQKWALDTKHGLADVDAAWARYYANRRSHSDAVALRGATDKEFIIGIRHLHELQAAIERAPDITGVFNATKKYQAALDALTAKFPQYKDMINDLLSALNQLADVRMPDAKFAAAFARLNAMRKAAEKSTDPKVIEKYLKARDALSNKSAQTQMQAAEQAASYQDQLDQEAAQKAKEAADEAKRKAEAAAEAHKRLMEQNVENAKNALQTINQTIMQFRENALQENEGFMGQLFGGPFMQGATMQNRIQFGFKARPEDLLADQFAQLQQFRKFQTGLSNLRQKGVPAEMVAQLRAMGTEGQNIIDAMNKMSPQQLQKSIGWFKTRQKLIQQATDADLKRQMTKWESFGKKVMLAILRGLKSETPGIEDAIYNRVLGLFPGLAGQAHAKPRATPRAGGASNHYNIVQNRNVHYNLPAHLEGTALLTQLKAAHWIDRNKD